MVGTFGVLEVVLAPAGGTIGNACANCKRIYGSNSNHTDRQYWAVDSITASFTSCSRNQLDNRAQVARHGRKSSPFRLAFRPMRIDHHHQHFLVYRQFRLSCRTLLPPGVEAVERTQRGVTHRHVLPPFPPGRVARHRLVQNCAANQTRKRPHFIQSSHGPLPSHAGLIVHHRLSLIFMAMGAPQARAKLGSIPTLTRSDCLRASLPSRAGDMLSVKRHYTRYPGSLAITP
jgi:hypothetical protein